MKKLLFFLKPALIVFVFSSFLMPQLYAQSNLLLTMTWQGGTRSSGAIIGFNPSNNTDEVLWSFGGSGDGSSPWSSLTYDPANGLYYGMTQYGGSYAKGVIFSFDAANNSENVLCSLGHGTDGAQPVTELVYYPPTGLLYAMTGYGGTHSAGAVISFNPVTGRDSVLWSFGGGADGYYPGGDMAFDAGTGLFYGLTGSGGTDSLGTLFSFNPNTNAENVLWNFGVDSDGAQPYGTLAYDPANGLYYTMTNTGGSGNRGAIISFNPAGNVEHLVWSLGRDSDGAYPSGVMTYDSAHALFYGLTESGSGNYNKGAIISFNPATGRDNLLWSFGSGTDGYQPGEGLTYNPDNGLYYGMTTWGGMNSDGAVFTFNPATNAENVVWNFGADTDGAKPFGYFVPYNTPTGIRAVANVPAINIYPNPGSGLYTITGLSDGQLVEVYNCLGQKVRSLTAETVTEQMDITGQANGIYLVQVVNSDGSLAEEKKVVKIF